MSCVWLGGVGLATDTVWVQLAAVVSSWFTYVLLSPSSRLWLAVAQKAAMLLWQEGNQRNGGKSRQSIAWFIISAS